MSLKWIAVINKNMKIKTWKDNFVWQEDKILLFFSHQKVLRITSFGAKKEQNFESDVLFL